MVLCMFVIVIIIVFECFKMNVVQSLGSFIYKGRMYPYSLATHYAEPVLLITRTNTCSYAGT